MKNTNTNVAKRLGLLAIIALIAVIGFSMISCEGDDTPTVDEVIEGATSMVYRGIDSAANLYELAISKTANRAAFDPISGDDYELTVTPPNASGKKSKGAVQESLNGGFILKPSGATNIFNVAISGDDIVAVQGEIKYTDDSTSAVATALLPPKAPGDTNIADNIFVSGATVYYDHRIGQGPNVTTTSATEARTITDFGYIFMGNNDESFKGVTIGDLVDNASVTIANGKLDITLGTPSEFVDIADAFKGELPPSITVTPNDAQYFGSGGDVAVFCNFEGKLKDYTGNVYGLILVKDGDDSLTAGFVYVDKPMTLKGILNEEHGDSRYYNIFDCSFKTGWNYIFTSVTGDENNGGKYTTITADTRLPSSYKWMVIDMNFPLNFNNGDGDGHGDGG